MPKTKLWNLINNKVPDIIEKRKISYLKDKTVVIDANFILMSTCIAYRKTGYDFQNKDGKPTTHIKAILDNVGYYIKHNITPIYVFDGKSHYLKKETIDKRRKTKEKSKQQCAAATTKEDYIKYYKRTVELGSDRIKDVKIVLDLMGIPYIQSLEEADSQIAEMTNYKNIAEMTTHKKIAGAISDDIDIILFGGENLIRRKKDNLEIINLNNLLNSFKKYFNKDFTHENLVDLVVMMGSEYLDSLKNTSTEKILSYYKKNNMDLKKTINNMEQEGYVISSKFKEKWLEVKQYFLYPRVIKHQSININVNKPDKIGLIHFLYDDNQFNKDRIEKIYNTLKTFYKTNK